MQGQKCSRNFDVKEELVLFANLLYVNKYERFGKISYRPTPRALDAAKAWAFKNNFGDNNNLSSPRN